MLEEFMLLAVNQTTGPVSQLSKPMLISFVVDCVNFGVDSFLLSLLLLAFIGNRSFVIFMPSTISKCCMNAKTSRKYKTRTLLNWTLFHAMLYILVRIAGLILSMIGVWYLNSRPLLNVFSNLVHIFAHWYYLFVFSWIVVLWMKISMLWFKGTPSKERLIKIGIYTALVAINICSAICLFNGGLVLVIRPYIRNPKLAFRLMYTVVAAMGQGLNLLALTILAIMLGIRVVYMMHRSSKVGKKNEKEANRQKSTMTRVCIAMVFIIIASIIRMVGFFLILGQMPTYVWSLFTRAVSDLFGLSAIIFLFWPYQIASCWEPIANLINNTDTTGTEATDMADVDIDVPNSPTLKKFEADEFPTSPTSPTSPSSAMSDKPLMFNKPDTSSSTEPSTSPPKEEQLAPEPEPEPTTATSVPIPDETDSS